MKISIVGTGFMGSGLGKLFARKGHEVLFTFSRSPEKIRQAAADAGANARTGSPEEAAAFGDVIVLAVGWRSVEEALKSLGPLQGKTLLSCVNPLSEDYRRLVVGTTSSGAAMVGSWSLGPLVEALRGLRGIDMISAATFIASTGDLSRFESPRLLMGYLGLVPSEHSSGGTIRRGGITKTGNREARRMLIEAAWSYQYPARIAKEKAEILVCLPKSIRDIAWKAQTRLCARYRSMIARGKKPTVVVAAIARELAGFIWAIGREVKLNTATA